MQIFLQLLMPCLVYNLLASAAPSISSRFTVNELLSDEIAIELNELNKEFQLIFSHPNGITKSLKLIKSEIKSISPHLNYGELDLNSNGELVIQSPAKHYAWVWAQHDVYNAENHPDVHLVRNFVNGNHTFEGILGDKALKWDGTKHFVLNSLPDMPFPEEYDYSNRKKRNDNETTRYSDIVDPHRRFTYGRVIETGPAVAHVEMAIVFDYVNSKFFDFDQKRITEYSSVYFNFINEAFASSEDPKITFTVVDIFVTKGPEVETYIIGSRIEENSKVVYHTGTMLGLFAKWSIANAKTIGKHDLIALLTAKQFNGATGGMAFLGRVCGFNENGGADISASVTMESQGTWASRYAARHEIGHNLGADHDNEGKSLACPQVGDMMGGNWKNSLSDCSKASIKAVVISQQGSCLKTDERTSIEVEVDMEYIKRELFQIVCQRTFNGSFPEVADHINPTESCQGWVWCMNYVPGIGERTPTDKVTHYTCVNGTKCGKTGTCQGEICIGDRGYEEKAELDALCKNKTGDKTAFYNRDNYGIYNPCRWLSCEGSQEKYNYIKYWMGDGTVCKRDGKCINGECAGFTPAMRRDLDRICQVGLKDETITGIADNLNPNNMCTGWSWCMKYDPSYGKRVPVHKLLGWTKDEGTICGRSGVCRNNTCVDDSPYTDKEELDKLCQNKLGDTKAFYNANNYGSYNPCQWLSCEAGKQKYNHVNFWMGDNAPCKNDGKCLNGECVGFKPATRRDLDRICQVGLMDETITGIADNLNPNHMCEGWSWCMKYEPGFGERKPVHTNLHFAKDEGTNCGRTGECRGNSCVGDSPYTDKGELDELCQRKLGDTKAFYNAYSYGTYNPCQWLSCEGTGQKFNFISFWMGENAPCKNNGTCKNGECVGDSPYTDKGELDKFCQNELGDTKAFYNANNYGTYNPCQWLSCEGNGNKFNFIKFRTGENAPCKNNGTCKNGECIGYGPLKRAEIDIACQVGKLNKSSGAADDIKADHMCQDWTWCMSYTPGYGERVPVGEGPINFKKNDGTECGKSGTCKNQICVGDSAFTDKKQLDLLCQEKVGDPTAVFDETAYEWPHGRCDWLGCQGSEGKAIIKFWMGDNAPCEDGGKCKDGSCLKTNEQTPLKTQVNMDSIRSKLFEKCKDGSCLKTDERTPVEAEVNIESLKSKFFEKVCQRVFNESFHEVADNINPNEFCDGWVSCMNYVPGTEERTPARVTTYHTCENGTRCGKTGTCQGKLCIGDRAYEEKAELDTLCKNKTGDETAFYNRDNYGTYNPCRWLSCEGSQKKYSHINYWMGDNAVCKNDGKCLNGECVGFKPATRRDLDRICQVGLKDETITGIADNLNPNNMCTGWSWCMKYDPSYGKSVPVHKGLGWTKDEGTICGRSGVCRNNTCVDDSPYTDKEELDKLCQNKLGDTKAFYNANNYGSYNPCQWLSCEAGKQKYNHVNFWMGDNARCKNDGKCLNGECVGFKPATRRDLDRICQVGLMDETITGIADNLNPNHMCEGWSWCMKYEPGFGERKPVHTNLHFAKDEGTNCGRTGECRGNLCVGDSPYTDKGELDELCQRKLGDTKAFYNANNYGTYNPCQWLSCEGTGQKFNFISFWVGENAPCRNNGTCKNGECIGYGPLKRAEIDIACQVGKLNKSSGAADDIKADHMCQDWTWCMSYTPGYGERVPVGEGPINFKKNDGTECGKSGTCRNQICIGDSGFTDKKQLDMLCQEKVGDPTAVFDETAYEWPHGRCDWLGCTGSEGKAIIKFWMGDNTPCEDGGKCKDGSCQK